YRPNLTFCGNVNTTPAKTIGEDFTQDQTLDAIAYGGDWIALACGNFHLPVAGAKPVPVIRGFKFNDANRNGVQDNGETGLAGLTFTLSRVASLVGQPNADSIAVTTSDAEGNFSFALDGQGPGTYVVTEQFDPDWPNSDWPSNPGLSRTVVVPEGADNGENLPVLSFGDRQEIPPVPQANPQQADQDSPEGAHVTLDGSGSYSPTGDALSYHWSWPGGSADGANVPVVMPPGVTTVRLTVSDGIMSNYVDTTMTVYPPITATAMPVSAVEGQPFTAPVATFTDPDPSGTAGDYLAMVDWGDGAPASPGDITKSADGTFTVTGQHTYAEEGSYPVSVTVTDDDVPYNTDTVGGTGTVTDAVLAATGVDFLSTNPVNRVLATFTDANPTGPLSDFTATIDWGDGTPATSGMVAGPTGGPFTVSGDHSYSTLGYKTITIHITDVGGSTATAVDHLLLYATSGFVIGDLNSAVGAQVSYWGAQWWKLNSLSGGSAPAAFKGYQDSTGGDIAATTWTSRPGNSSGPPATVPAFISVIVASQVSQDGSTINGDAPHIVIVQTDPGYAANPGHAGQGTVVAQVR
ncbi:MAG TPA: PKD domain-containing protein, partial [Jatrophihabitans sp.]|nr:PKD domain-containing protein [Jatrophihabitans sp.]